MTFKKNFLKNFIFFFIVVGINFRSILRITCCNPRIFFYSKYIEVFMVEPIKTEKGLNNILLTYKCFECGSEFVLDTTIEKFSELEYNHIQEVYPELSADDRELMISGMCGKCYDKLFDGE